MSWPKVALGDVVSFLGGGTPSKKNPEYWGGQIPWATVKDINGPSLDRTIDSITEEGLRNSPSRLVPIGTVILPTRMALGRAAITTLPVAINQDLKAVVPKDSVNPRYLLHFFQSASDEIQTLGAGATVQGVTLEKLSSLQIPLPPLVEQQRIAVVLDRTDALRRARRESLHLSDELLRAVFIKTFGSETSPACPRVKLSDYLDFITSGGRGWAKYYSAEGAKFIRSLDVRMNEINDSQMIHVTPPNNAEADRTRIRVGDVLLTITGSLIGRVAAVSDAHAGAYVSQHVAILRTHGFDPEFLSWALSMEEGQRQIQKHQTGQTKPGLNFDQIGRLTIPKPSEELEKAFVRLIRARRQILAHQRDALDCAETFFSSLQQRAFKGELDLSRLVLSAPDVPAATVHFKFKSLTIKPTNPKVVLRLPKAPQSAEVELRRLDGALEKGEQISWSRDYFKYRLLARQSCPFSFADLSQRIQSVFTDAPYEEIKDLILEMLGHGGQPAVLQQRFDLGLGAAGEGASDGKEIVFEPAE